MQDKRSEPRQRIVLQGEIISGNGLRMSCAIRDISDRGARVSVVTPFHVTDRLTLLFLPAISSRWRAFDGEKERISVWLLLAWPKSPLILLRRTRSLSSSGEEAPSTGRDRRACPTRASLDPGRAISFQARAETRPARSAKSSR